MAAHRYWRLLIHANGTADNWCSIASLKGMAVLDGPNLLTGGTASASSTYGAGYSPDKAFDGNIATEWTTNVFADGAWLQYDLGAGGDQDIIQIAIVGRDDGGRPAEAPTNADWEYSDDGVTWALAFSVNPPVMTAQGQEFDYPEVPKIKIAKANIAVGSRPGPRIVVSKANLMIGSHPPGRVVISKVNIAIASGGIPEPVSSGRRRPLFVS